ncbi:MAG: GNAT family N-acetyltransferase [Flavobacteriaceae bacterium]
MIKIETKTFQELSTDELYSILQLRSAIFVVEQDCVYQDLDGKDALAIHVLGKKEGELVAYTRIFAPGAYFKEASIGRVAVKKQERQFGYGREIMLASIKAVQDYFQESKIHLSAQTYLTQFYQSLGFVAHGETYLEDDIPHIAMFKTK